MTFAQLMSSEYLNKYKKYKKLRKSCYQMREKISDSLFLETSHKFDDKLIKGWLTENERTIPVFVRHIPNYKLADSSVV